MESDSALVKLTLMGGHHHYGVLVHRYADYLFGLGMRLTRGDRALSEDLSQQSFLKSYLYLKSFDLNKSYKHWLTGIALNCFKDLRRDHWDYVPLVEADEPQLTPDFRSDDAFFELIRPLSPEERALVTLRYVYEYQVDEIAELMNLKSGTTKSKLSRALEKLR